MANIVLVEDEDEAAELIAGYVTNLPGEHRLYQFSTSGEALGWVRANRADLFILDIQLPDYRGTELGQQIRAMPEHRFTPILFTTELAGEELAAYREIKCYDFLVKPFTEAQFRRAVTEALELGRRMGCGPGVLRVEQKQFLLEYNIPDILYIESFGKQAVIHYLAGGREMADRVSGYSLARLLDLTGGALTQCHKSYLINTGRLSRVDRSQKLLWLRDCCEAIPVGDKYQANLSGR